MSKNSYRKRKNGFASFLKVLLVLATTVGLAFGAAALWQSAENAADTSEEPPASFVPEPRTPATEQEPLSASASAGSSIAVIVPSTVPESSTEPDNPEASKPEDASSSGVASQASSSAASSEAFVNESSGEFRVREEYSYALPQNPKKVGKAYFDDALFFGDSLSVGIQLYGIMDNAGVLAFQGINPISINTQQVVNVNNDGNRVTMLEAAKTLYPDKTKIYIMLGGNGLGLDEESFISGYKTFVQSIRQEYPAAKIFIQSITPVTDNAHLVYPSVSNEKINRYNLLVMELARDEKVYFVDVAVALMNDEGKLPTAASPNDGMHVGPEYYYKWLDYLMSHTVED